MSSPYTQQVIKVIVAQVCQTIGWNSIQSTPLELLGDILHKYLQEISHQTHRYSELYGRSEPNLDDVGLAFRDMNVSISDLEEYVANVDPVPCAIDVPKFPLQKENHLNFLKPGSKEVVTRPVHIHEHLPPIFPDKEEKEVPDTASPSGNEQPVETDAVPKDEKELYSQPADNSEATRLRTLNETEVRLTREITSVMMTTSGFISPAREGKLPDSKAPPIQHFEFAKPVVKETAISTLVGSSATASLPLPEKVEKTKKKRPTAAGSEKDRNKDKVAKELFRATKVQPMGPPPPKQMPALAGAIFPPSNSPMAAVVEHQIQQSNKRSPTVTTPKAASNRKHHKRKDPNKVLVGGSKVIDGKISKKRKKLLDKKKTDDTSLPAVEPVGQYDAQVSVKPANPLTERPPTPDIPKESLQENIQRVHMPMPQQFDVIPGPSSTPEQPAPIVPAPMVDATVKSQFEGKIASEPDKRKLNIIKRISSKTKDEIKIPQFNLPETSIFPIDDSHLSFGPPIPVPMPRKKPKQLNGPTATSSPTTTTTTTAARPKNIDQPLNMSIPKGTDLTVAPFASSALPMTSKKEPKPKKVREKKPPKVREKKTKQPAPEWPKTIAGPGSAIMIATQSQPLPPPVLPPSAAIPPATRKLAHLPPTLGNIDDPIFNHFANIAGAAGVNQSFGAPGSMFNWPQFAANGPSLIPNNSFFPHFNMNRPPFGPVNVPPPPFGLVPSADLLSMNDYPPYKRTRLDVSDQIQALPIHTEKAQCNVAPLLPASIKLDDMDTSPNATKHRSPPPPHTPSIDLTDDGPLDVCAPLAVPIKAELFGKSKHPTTVASASVVATCSSTRPSSASSSFSDSSTVQKFTSNKRDRSESPAMFAGITPMDLCPSASTMSDNLSDTIADASAAVTIAKEKSIKSVKRKEKEHRKERKDKDAVVDGVNVKLKKKKDKKDKTKTKEKSEKRKEKEEKKREKELKEKTRKEKREKKKEKERAAAAASVATEMTNDGSMLGNSSTAASMLLAAEAGNDSNMSTNDSEASVPKLTLKLGASPRPNTPDYMRKLTIKPSKKERGNIDHNVTADPDVDVDDTHDSDQNREPSPELARISALVTRPPKQKTLSTNESSAYQLSSSDHNVVQTSDNDIGFVKDDFGHVGGSPTASFPPFHSVHSSFTDDRLQPENSKRPNFDEATTLLVVPIPFTPPLSLSEPNVPISSPKTPTQPPLPPPLLVTSVTELTSNTMPITHPPPVQQASRQSSYIGPLEMFKQNKTMVWWKRRYRYLNRQLQWHRQNFCAQITIGKKDDDKTATESPTKPDSVKDLQMTSPVPAVTAVLKGSGAPTPTRGGRSTKTSPTTLVTTTGQQPATLAVVVTTANPQTVVPTTSTAIITTTTTTSPSQFLVKNLQQRKMNPPKLGDAKTSSKLKSKSVINAVMAAATVEKAEPTVNAPSTSLTATNVRDSEGNQVWICPACGRVDDGTPMIGCDGCDAWYHWVCVGIQVPPDTNEDWYCRVCIAKKQECQGGDKKKKRKKKDKKEH